MIFCDSETCGLHGMAVLLQYAEDDGPVRLYDVWKHPIHETLRLIEHFCTQTIVGYNLAFDWLHICKLYTIFSLCDPNWIPEDHIDEIAMREPEGRDGPCLKPHGALDLMLHSRKGPFQSLMARDDIRIRKVPTALAYALAHELEQRVQFDNIYFARRADQNAPRWQVFDCHNRYGDLEDDFKDVVLKFAPAGGLKFLAEHILKRGPKYHYKDIEPQVRPAELGYAPFALAIATSSWLTEDNKPTWPALIAEHIEHWATREDAREYAKDDVVYTRALYEHFGRPEANDTDSTLACMVAAVRWHGFVIDIPGIQKLLSEAQAIVDTSPVNINQHKAVRAYIAAAMDETERLGSQLDESTKKAHLDAVSKWTLTEPEPCCEDQTCQRCGGKGLQPGPHPAALRAKQILDIKIAAKEVELYRKLLIAGRFHASFIVVGTLSSRMAGTDGLNAQGIKREPKVRSMFPLAWDDYVLSLGDFAAFEVTIADAVCNDEALRNELLTKVTCHKCLGTGKNTKTDVACAACDGEGKATQKIHALFGMALYPGKTYEEIRASEGTASDMYTIGKNSFFGTILYGGNKDTLIRKYNIKREDAINAIESFGNRFLGVKKWRQRVTDSFCSMTQPGGIGTAVVWKDPVDYVETFLGFRRYFTLENQTCKALFDLARKPPKEWAACKVKVVRSDRLQTASGAISSALYGAAFQLQAANMRAAANHEIQSPGAEITKAVQRRIWDLQPSGIHAWIVAPMNVHDEILCVNHPSVTEKVANVVEEAVESFRPHVPLIGMEWFKQARNWAGKKGTGTEGKVTIGPKT